MREILYLIGKSSSGKDTIKTKLIDALNKINYKTKELVLYTTREIRNGEIDGVDYNFVSELSYQKYLQDNKIIESRTYNKVQGTVRYFTVFNDSFFDESEGYVIGIGTLESYNELKSYFAKKDKFEIQINAIYLEVENSNRLLRAIRRELKEEKEKQNFEEVCRRFEADEMDYSTKKLEESGIEKVFTNNSIDTTVEEILNYYVRTDIETV